MSTPHHNSDDDNSRDDENPIGGYDSVPTPLALSYLQLIRLPNVFTAVADVLMGFLFTHESLDPLSVCAALVLSSSLLYMAGMILNDVFDIEIDRKERPERPLSSGRISIRVASCLGAGMLFAGIVAAGLASYLANDLRCGFVGLLLAVMIVGYDLVFKRTMFGPLAMGLCRFLNVLLGMSAAVIPLIDEPAVWTTPNFVAAGGIGVYIMGVTWFAKKEAEQSPRGQLLFGIFFIYQGLALLAGLWHWRNFEQFKGLNSLAEAPHRWFLLWALLAMGITWRCWRAVANPAPKYVQSAVQFAIYSLIVLDAVVCVAATGIQEPAFGGIPGPILIIALLLPTMGLGRLIYST